MAEEIAGIVLCAIFIVASIIAMAADYRKRKEDKDDR